jgi:hypothetical protein
MGFKKFYEAAGYPDGGAPKQGETPDHINGGVADGKTPDDIAKKHGVSLSKIEKELEMGIEVEMEHTDDSAIAKEIALDHLSEFPDYYTRLKKMEKQAKEETDG